MALVLAVSSSALANTYTFTIIDVPGATFTQTFGINDVGQIVGDFIDAANNGHGFLDTGGVFTTQDVPGTNHTVALGINTTDQIVGSFVSGGLHGFLYIGVVARRDILRSYLATPERTGEEDW